MKKLGCTLLAALAVMQAEALLPPLYQTADEIKAILSDEQLGKVLSSGEAILKIENKNSDFDKEGRIESKIDFEKGRGNVYEITTRRNSVQAIIRYQDQDRPGPAQYQVFFKDSRDDQ